MLYTVKKKKKRRRKRKKGRKMNNVQWCPLFLFPAFLPLEETFRPLKTKGKHVGDIQRVDRYDCCVLGEE